MIWDLMDFTRGDAIRVEYPDGSLEETIVMGIEPPNQIWCHDGRPGSDFYKVPVQWVRAKYFRHYWMNGG